jgi:hypothetical protein
VTDHIDLARLDVAVGASRRVLLEHAASCARCRRALAQRDPSSIFALLSLKAIPGDAQEAVSKAVARGAGRDRALPAEALSSSGPARRVVAAAVVVLALASGIATVVLRPSGPPAAPAALAAARADVDVRPTAAVSEVVDFTVGETQVVMVYNGDLRL